MYGSGPPWLYAFVLAIVAIALAAAGNYKAAAASAVGSLLFIVALLNALRRYPEYREGYRRIPNSYWYALVMAAVAGTLVALGEAGLGLGLAGLAALAAAARHGSGSEG